MGLYVKVISQDTESSERVKIFSRTSAPSTILLAILGKLKLKWSGRSVLAEEEVMIFVSPFKVMISFSDTFVIFVERKGSESR